MTEEEKKFMETITEKVKELIPSSIPTSDQLKDIATEAAKGIKELEANLGKSIDELKKDDSIKSELVKLNEVLKTQGLELNQLKEKSTPKAIAKDYMGDGVQNLIKSFVKSSEFKDFMDNGCKGSTSRFSLKKDGNLIDIEKADKDELEGKTVSVSTDHTGNIFITDPRLNIKDFPMRNQHIRDLMPIDSTTGTQITAPEVYDYTDAITGGMGMLSENGEAQDIGFKTRENTWTLNRIAAALPLSKRYMKTNGLNWTASYLGQRMPSFVRNKEDFQILFGDGSGENVDGLTKDAQSFNLDRDTYVVTDVYSVATWNSGNQTVVKFNTPHLMRNGDNVTFANATNVGYNTTHLSCIVVDELNIVINEAYVAETLAQVAAWTGSSASPWKNAVNDANIYDVIVVAANELKTGEYMATGAVLSPVDFDKMGLIKADDMQYVGVARDAFGRVNINGLSIVQAIAMPAGQFLVGDFQMAVAISEYTPLSIRAVEDTTDAKKNQVTWIIEEEFIMPKYNPYWFIFGYVEAAKTQLETA